MRALLLLFLAHCGAESIGPLPQIYTDEAVEHAEKETRSAAWWYCYENSWVPESCLRDLTIYVTEKPRGCRSGEYFSRDKLIYVAWEGGPSANSLFHELLHHDLWSRLGKADFAELPYDEHTERFQRIVERLQNRWTEMRSR